ncbi:alpha/beta fold hydrolase [Lacinutrix sp. C3R15]|uniref:YheT family hydrolase n=1 Tax=Flavobacteriaceae TaxID=49546 RepID=UPI001C0A14B4|nr:MULTISPECIES: alpha/beta fold hydrolase [Flavobacteriaceae]MBU2940512.1 alpha/beta fold hydrolase [Lacinutrix sp. C3R15]MDO6623832.1 alpha/beta fold hydrolase [Oceanihabitans sp. 1_MG-2023]
MPILTSTYKPSIFFRNGNIATIYSGLLRKVKLEQKRERITLSDGDFLDLDWSYAKEKSEKLIIVLHGLEGNAQRPYVTGPSKLFNENGVDAVCINFRGCSGEPNLKYRSYHSGATEDLHEVIEYILENKNYSEIYINGFSLGGNITLKYLGEDRVLPKQIKAAISISVPCYLEGSANELHKLKNKPYAIRFKKHLVDKLQPKLLQFPNNISEETISSIKVLRDFDEVYTSKAHGFTDARDYYTKSSCLQFLPNIKVPTLIINALNDSFLSPECYPVIEAKNNKNLHLEMPSYGGHVGFVKKGGYYYNELRALEFIKQL